MLCLVPGTPCPLGLGERPEATAPPLRASCPLQYEAVMDRVQKSKLSLYKKAMDVSVRVSGMEAWRTHGVDPRALGWAPGTGPASDHLSNSTHHGLLGARGCPGNQGPMWIGPPCPWGAPD